VFSGISPAPPRCATTSTPIDDADDVAEDADEAPLVRGAVTVRNPLTFAVGDMLDADGDAVGVLVFVVGIGALEAFADDCDTVIVGIGGTDDVLQATSVMARMKKKNCVIES
jgi:hypothetical protein